MEVEVACPQCDEFFTIKTDEPELGVVKATCPVCGTTSDMMITEVYS